MTAEPVVLATVLADAVPVFTWNFGVGWHTAAEAGCVAASRINDPAGT
jgi:hypothetical protein